MSDDLLSILSNGQSSMLDVAPAPATPAATSQGDPAVWTVLGEAGSDPEGQRAVASTYVNRMKISGAPSAAAVATDPANGYEAWQDPKARAAVMRQYPVGSPAYVAAQANIAPIVTGAVPAPYAYDSFYSPRAQTQLGRNKPTWDDGTGTNIGGNLFFAGKYGKSGGPPADLLSIISDGRLNSSALNADQPATPAGPSPVAAPAAPTDPNVLNAETQQPVNAAQGKGVEAWAATHGMNPNAPPGSAGKPYLVTSESDQAPAGAYYFDMNGQLHSPDVLATVGAGLVQGANDVRNTVMAPIAKGVEWADSHGLAPPKFLGGNPQETAQSVAAAQGAAQQGATNYNQLFGGSPYATAGRIGGNIVASAPLMAGADAVVAPITAAAKAAPVLGGVADFLGGTAGAGGSGAGNLLLRGGSLGARGAVQGGEAAGLTGSASNQPFSQQVSNGALTGAVLGPTFHALGSTAGNVVNKLTGPATNTAEARVANTLLRALDRDNISPADAVAAARADPTAPAFHAGGPNLAALSEVAAKTPGPALTMIQNAVLEHQAAVPSQIKSDIGTALGGQGDYLSTLDNTIAARRTAANQGMLALQTQPISLSPDSVLALRSPLANGAIKKAALNALTSVDPQIRASGAQLNGIADQVLDNPGAAQITIGNAQAISKSLLDAADGAFRSGDGSTGVALKTLGRAVRDNASNPDLGGSSDYANWLKSYGDDSDNISALQLGHNVFSAAGGNNAASVQKTLSGMGDAAGDYYRKGVAEALIDQARSSQGGVGTMRQLLRNEDLQDKVKIAFPDQNTFEQFVQSAQKRVGQQNLNNRIMGGSPTYPLQAARADVENQPNNMFDMVPHAIEVGSNMLTGNVGALAGKSLKAALKAVPRSDRSVIGNPATNALLGQALTDPDAMKTLLSSATLGPRSLTIPKPNLLMNAGRYAQRGIDQASAPASAITVNRLMQSSAP